MARRPRGIAAGAAINLDTLTADQVTELGLEELWINRRRWLAKEAERIEKELKAKREALLPKVNFNEWVATDRAILDLALRRRIALERYSSAQHASLVEFLQIIEQDIAQRLSVIAAGPLGRQSRKYDELINLKASVHQLVDDVTQHVTGLLSNTLGGLAGSENAHVAGMLEAIAEREGGARLRLQTQRITLEAAMQAAMTRPMSGYLLQDWLQNLSPSMRDRVDATLRTSFIEGEALGVTKQRLRAVTQQSSRGLEALIRTSNAHVAAAVADANYSANADIVQGVEWVSVLDARTTDVCFPAETIVQAVGETEKLFRRWYEGDFIVITTAAGKQIRGTPNHPILTPHGWLALHEVEVGQQVFNADLGKVGAVHGDQNVSVPTSFGAIADALDQPALADVFTKRASPADFHGDGMGPDYEVDILRPKSNLWLRDDLSLAKHVRNALFGCSEVWGQFTTLGRFDLLSLAKAPTVKAAQIAAGTIQALIEPTLGATAFEAVENDRRAHAAFEHFDHSQLVSADKLVSLPLGEAGPNPGALEETCDGGDGGAVLTGDLTGGGSIRVFADHVVSVRREHAACHVFNLQTSLGYYIAGGLIVKNCRARDGKVWPVDSGPRPPAHINCRSTTKVVLIGVEPSPRETYAEWLKRQDAATQDDILGPARGKLFRSGKMTVDRFVDMKGKRIPLADLKS